MPNPYNGSRNGQDRSQRTRGTNKHRLSRKEYIEPDHRTSDSGRAADAGIYFECFQDIERKDTHLIPRRSLTDQQGLRVFPELVEFEELTPIPRTQRDQWNRRDTKTTDPNLRVTWKSDKTLLRPGKPFAFGEGKTGTRFSRVTSQTKVRRRERPEHKQSLDTFKCKTCGHTFEALRHPSATVHTLCPNITKRQGKDVTVCGSKDIELITGTEIIFDQKKAAPGEFDDLI